MIVRCRQSIGDRKLAWRRHRRIEAGDREERGYLDTLSRRRCIEEAEGLEHVLVRAVIVRAGATDLHLDAVQGRAGVDDQRSDALADVQHDELRMRAG